MNLVELCEQTPVAKHGDIIISRDRVFVRDTEGTEEYSLEQDGELRLIRSDRDIHQQLARIKAKLGA